MKKLIVIFAVIAMVGAFTATTMAAEWNFYGSARMNTFYESYDSGIAGDSTVDGLDHDLQGNARIGANVKFNDQIGGRFEYGSGPNLRILYGTYTFDGGEFLIGQTYGPLSGYFYSDSVYGDDGDLLGVGQFYSGREPMLQLKMGGFKVALLKTRTGDALGGAVTTQNVYEDEINALFTAEGTDIPTVDSTAATSTEVSWPKIELAYRFKADQWFLDVFGGYQTYKELGTAVGDEDIDSWVAGLGGGVDFGAMYLKAGFHFSQNSGNYGATNGGMAKISNGQVIDNDGFGYLAVLGYKASDSINIEAGYGSSTNELDESGSNDDEIVQYYANLTYTIAPGFFIVPEIGYIDYKDGPDGQPEGDTTYGGLKWQINF